MTTVRRARAHRVWCNRGNVKSGQAHRSPQQGGAESYPYENWGTAGMADTSRWWRLPCWQPVLQALARLQLPQHPGADLSSYEWLLAFLLPIKQNNIIKQARQHSAFWTLASVIHKLWCLSACESLSETSLHQSILTAQRLLFWCQGNLWIRVYRPGK